MPADVFSFLERGRGSGVQCSAKVLVKCLYHNCWVLGSNKINHNIFVFSFYVGTASRADS